MCEGNSQPEKSREQKPGERENRRRERAHPACRTSGILPDAKKAFLFRHFRGAPIDKSDAI
jgi:hypothetical protein